MEEKIIGILREMIPEDKNAGISFSGKTDIINEVGLDSLSMVSFLLRLEEDLDVEIDISKLEISHLNSIDNLCAFIQASSLNNAQK